MYTESFTASVSHVANGDFHEGHFRQGKKRGYGSCVYRDGRQYNGKFVDDECEDKRREASRDMEGRLTRCSMWLRERKGRDKDVEISSLQKPVPMKAISSTTNTMAWALVDTRMVGCMLGCSSAARHMARSLPIRTKGIFARRCVRVVCHAVCVVPRASPHHFFLLVITIHTSGLSSRTPSLLENPFTVFTNTRHPLQR
jgi:hypothetical protein